MGTWLYQVNCRVNRPSRWHNLAAFLGLVDLSPVGQATWFHFHSHFILANQRLIFFFYCVDDYYFTIVSMVESTGVYFALGDITGRKLAKMIYVGYHAEGLAVILGILIRFLIQVSLKMSG